MNFMEMLLKRESCRAYADKAVTREQLIKIVEAGRLSPSGCNAQPWKFVVVDEEQALEKVREALVLDNGKTACAWRDSVPAFIVVTEEHANVMPMVLEQYDDSQRFALGDIGMATMNMCYMAMEMGLSTCVVGMNEQAKMEKALNIPEGHTVRLALAVGYAKEEKEPRKKTRKPFEEVVSFNEW